MIVEDYIRPAPIAAGVLEQKGGNYDGEGCHEVWCAQPQARASVVVSRERNISGVHPADAPSQQQRHDDALHSCTKGGTSSAGTVYRRASHRVGA